MISLLQKLTLFISLIFTTSASSALFCFSPKTSLAEVKQYISVLLLPTDQVQTLSSGNCLDININASRKDLFERFLAKRYSFKTSLGYSGSSTAPTRSGLVGQHCKLNIKRVGSSQEKRTNAKVFGRSGNGASTGNSSMNDVSSMQMVLKKGRKGKIQMGSEEVSLGCLKSFSSYSEVDVSVYSKRTGSYLSTSVSLRKGDRINLGDIVKNLKNKSSDISTTTGVGYRNNQTSSKFTWYLELSR